MVGRSGQQLLYTYKFASFGRKEAGKTAYLAALGSHTKITPPGGPAVTFAKTLRPLPRHGKVPTAEELEEDRLKINGEYQKSRDGLEVQSVPLPTESDLGFVRFLYMMTMPPGTVPMQDGSRSVGIELIDYSGELLSETAAETANARLLRQYLTGMDGLMIFAEVPLLSQVRAGGKAEEQFLKRVKELSLLGQAFARMVVEDQTGQRRYGRIAMLVNKWDRVSTINHADPQGERAKLHDWLASEPLAGAYQNLYTILLNKVGPENIDLIPVSAFGTYDIKNNIEVPAPAPLRPFNLELPLAFLVGRADGLDLELFKDSAARKRRPFFAAQLWRSLTHKELNPDCASMRTRMKGYSSYLQTVAQLCRSAARVDAMRALAACLLIVGSVLGGSTYSDLARKRDFAGLRPEQGFAAVEPMLPWLESYAAGEYKHIRYISYIFYSQEEAARDRSAVLQAHEDALSRRMTELDPRTPPALEAATDYLKYFSNGPAAPLARNIGALQKALEEARKWWDSASEAISRGERQSDPVYCRLANNLGPETMDPLRKDLDALPPITRQQPDFIIPHWKETLDRLGRLDAVKRRVSECWRTLLVERHLEDAAQAITDHKLGLAAAEIIKALDAAEQSGLTNLKANADQFLQSFASSLTGTVSAEKDSRIAQGDVGGWANADKFIAGLENDGSMLALLARLGPKGDSLLRELRQLREQHKIVWECRRYEKIYDAFQATDVFDRPSTLGSPVEAYRNEDHSKQRQGAVDELAAYLARLNDPLPVKVELTELSLEDTNGSPGRARVYLDDKLIVFYPFTGSGGRMHIFPSQQGLGFSSRLSAAVLVRAEASTDAARYYDSRSYDGKLSEKVRNLVSKPLRITLSGNLSNDGSIILNMTMSLPTPPTLPGKECGIR